MQVTCEISKEQSRLVTIVHLKNSLGAPVSYYAIKDSDGILVVIASGSIIRQATLLETYIFEVLYYLQAEINLRVIDV